MHNKWFNPAFKGVWTMIEIILALCIGFLSGYMVCSTIRNIDKKDKKIPFKEGIWVQQMVCLQYVEV